MARQATSATSASLQPVYAVSAFFSTMAAVYALAGIEPSPVMALGIAGGPLVASVSWFRRDARANHLWLPYDWQFLLFPFWPFWPLLLTWYAVRTRRRRAAGLVVRLLAAILAPILTSAVVLAFRAPAGG